MRIRSIKPEFYRSDDITELEWEHRLLFIGLWSYVDDNGVGLDKTASIAADLFAGDIELDPSGTFERVTRGLRTLFERGRITRYTVEGKAYLHVTNWEKHQRIDKPNKPRYPLPTCGNAEIREGSARVPRVSREDPLPGTEEQRNRGTEEVKTSSPAAPAKEFEQFWQWYPRKVGKQEALKAFKRAAAKVGSQIIIDGAERLALDPNLPPDRQFIPHPTSWLNAGRWEDEPLPPRQQGNGRPTAEDKARQTLMLGQQMQGGISGLPGNQPAISQGPVGRQPERFGFDDYHMA